MKNVDNNNERDILSLASGISSVQTIYVIAPDATPYPIGNNDLNDSKNINDGIAINGWGIFDITANIDDCHTFIPWLINNNDTAIPSGILCIANDIITSKPILSLSAVADTPTLIYVL